MIEINSFKPLQNKSKDNRGISSNHHFSNNSKIFASGSGGENDSSKNVMFEMRPSMMKTFLQGSILTSIGSFIEILRMIGFRSDIQELLKGLNKKG